MSEAPEPSPELQHLAKAMELSRKINDKVADALRPLEREMMIMGWAPEFRAIIWEAVKLAAAEKIEALDA